MAAGDDSAPPKLDFTTLEPEIFDPHVGKTVTAWDAESRIELRFVSVNRGRPPIPGVRERSSFSLTFMSDTVPGNPYGGMVTMDIPGLGRLEAVSITPNSGAPLPEWGAGQLWSITFG